MSVRSVEHGTFVIERNYGAPPERVFAAFSTLELKAGWSSCHEGARHELDFRVGGRETYRGGPKGGPTYYNETRYQDIVPNERIVYSYDMRRDDMRISVSLVTIEFRPSGKGTSFIFTEQGAYLDGHDSLAQREHGTKVGLDQLAVHLQAQ